MIAGGGQWGMCVRLLDRYRYLLNPAGLGVIKINKLGIVVFIISIVVVGGILIQRSLAPKLELPEPLEASVLIQHGDVDEYRVLSLADTIALHTLLHGQQLREQAPPCDFSETVAIRLNQGARVLHIGLGDCRALRDGETGKYVTLNRAQWNVFTEILASYGVTVPGAE